MNLYNQIKSNGYRINIYYDEDARSPREAYDNLGTLYTAHRRYRPEKEDVYKRQLPEERLVALAEDA